MWHSNLAEKTCQVYHGDIVGQRKSKQATKFGVVVEEIESSFELFLPQDNIVPTMDVGCCKDHANKLYDGWVLNFTPRVSDDLAKCILGSRSTIERSIGCVVLAG